MRYRTGAALAGVTAAAGVLVAASPAMAAGGGCIDHLRSGWNVGVCISAPNRVYGDFYVNTRGSLGSKCSIDMQIYEYDIAGNWWAIVAVRTDGCNTGHHAAMSTGRYTGKNYRTFVRVVVDDRVADSGYSPYVQ